MQNTVKNIMIKLTRLINRGQKRSIMAKKNIIASFIIKGLSIFIGFYMVPLTVGYVSKEQYGIWLTLWSVVGWFSFFDIGLGHGLRNKLSEALAKNEKEQARVLVSSTYAVLGLIIGVLLLLFFVALPYLNWQNILNTDVVSLNELRLVAVATFTFFCFNFILKLIYSIFQADQRPAKQNFYQLVGNFIALVTIFILTKTTSGSLLYLSITLGISPLLVLGLVSIFMFNGKYKFLKPSLAYVKVTQFQELAGLGVRFFLIKISSIVIFSTDNIIIAQVLGPSEVPAYAIAHKYFGLISALFAIVTVPFWSAYTEAYVKNDITWVLRTNKKLIKVWIALVMLSVFLLSISSFFYKFWVPEIEVPFILSVMMCVYVNVLAWGSIFVVFINGIGKIQLQLVVGIVSTLVNIPLSYFFAKTLGWGVMGVICATIICIAYGPVLAPIQFKKIINGTAQGIWNR